MSQDGPGWPRTELGSWPGMAGRVHPRRPLPSCRQLDGITSRPGHTARPFGFCSFQDRIPQLARSRFGTLRLARFRSPCVGLYRSSSHGSTIPNTLAQLRNVDTLPPPPTHLSRRVSHVCGSFRRNFRGPVPWVLVLSSVNFNF